MEIAKRIGFFLLAIMGWLLLVLFWRKVMQGDLWWLIGIILVGIPGSNFLWKAIKW